MKERYYDADAPSVIAAEVVRNGVSEGWSATEIRDLEHVRKVLAPFNIVYTDDMRGSWGRKASV